MKYYAIKKNFYAAAFIVVAILPFAAQAQWDSNWRRVRGESGLPGSDGSSVGGDAIADIFLNIMEWALNIFGFLAIIAFLVAGTMYLFSGGNETRAEKAKSAMLYAIIGVIVAMAGLLIINFIDAALSDEL